MPVLNIRVTSLYFSKISTYHTMARYMCTLECASARHPPIPLPHRTLVTVGRSRLTLIADKLLSKTQVELTADCIRKEVKVHVCGKCPSFIDDEELTQGQSGRLKAGKTLYLREKLYPYTACFTLQKDGSCQESNSCVDVGNSQKSTTIKRTHSSSDDADKQRAKKIKTDPDFDNTQFESKNQTGSKSPVKRSRPSTESSPSRSGAKFARIDTSASRRDEISDSDEEDERTRSIEARLTAMRDNQSNKPFTPSSISGPVGGGDGDHGDSEAPDRLGEPLSSPAWEDRGSLMVHRSVGLRASSKIASFDIDGTIICTQSGRVFPTHPGDWRIMYPEIPGCLKKLFRDGYKIVFFTNQKGIERGKVKVPDFQTKVERIIAKLGVPVHVLVSKGPAAYRKPGLGMWEHLKDVDNDGIKVNKSKSFYVGDAAGRPKDWAPGKKKDFSCSDRLFALNVGIPFYTPEEYFLKQSKAKFDMPQFDPRKLDPNGPLLNPPTAKLVAGQQEVVVFVGSPASGKTQFARQHLIPKGYVHVNRDTLKTWQKCVEMCRTALSSGKSVVIDNTNPDEESRQRYTEVARKQKVPCRCFVFGASLQHSRHNERFREMTDTSHQKINDMVMNSYVSKFKEPTTAEGFTEVVRVNFVPSFKNKSEELLYRQFLIDK